MVEHSWVTLQMYAIQDIAEAYKASAAMSLVIRVDACQTGFSIDTGLIEAERAKAAFAERLAAYRSSAEAMGPKAKRRAKAKA